MNLYSLTVSLHVLVAVLGLGLLGAVPIGARMARRSSLGLGSLGPLAGSLLRYVRVSLGLLFVTGGLLDFVARGAFHDMGWFRLSVGLLVVAGVSQHQAQTQLRRGLAGELDGSVALRRIERWGFTAMAAVAGIAILMELKPS